MSRTAEVRVKLKGHASEVLANHFDLPPVLNFTIVEEISFKEGDNLQQKAREYANRQFKDNWKWFGVRDTTDDSEPFPLTENKMTNKEEYPKYCYGVGIIVTLGDMDNIWAIIDEYLKIENWQDEIRVLCIDMYKKFDANSIEEAEEYAKAYVSSIYDTSIISDIRVKVHSKEIKTFGNADEGIVQIL